MSGGLINAQVAHAFNRFGLGARPDDPIPTNAMTWLTAQLTGTDPLAKAPPLLASCLYKENAAMAPPSKAQQQAQAELEAFFQSEQTNAFTAAVTTTTPFRERLVWFWTNFFAVQAGDDKTIGVAGAFVREAIRPYVLDTFENMLVAVVTHPAMLCSLNNDVSIGPQSPLALAQNFGGINENLGRELMELFTIGIGNYTQADVDALAYILTGWTVSYSGPSVGFVIDSDMHQPGEQTFLGENYPGTVFDGYLALQYLAAQPYTYTNIATRLLTHFVSDTPEQSDIETVASALSSSGGSLTAAYNAMINLASAWVPQTKLRTPFDLVVAAVRAVDAPRAQYKLNTQAIGQLGQTIWEPPFPNGWSDLGAAWASGAQMAMRTNFIDNFCKYCQHVDPAATANTALGALISPATTAMMAEVSSVHDKLTILFCSPDFQRR